MYVLKSSSLLLCSISNFLITMLRKYFENYRCFHQVDAIICEELYFLKIFDPIECFCFWSFRQMFTIYCFLHVWLLSVYGSCFMSFLLCCVRIPFSSASRYLHVLWSVLFQSTFSIEFFRSRSVYKFWQNFLSLKEVRIFGLLCSSYRVECSVECFSPNVFFLCQLIICLSALCKFSELTKSDFCLATCVWLVSFLCIFVALTGNDNHQLFAFDHFRTSSVFCCFPQMDFASTLCP